MTAKALDEMAMTAAARLATAMPWRSASPASVRPGSASYRVALAQDMSPLAFGR
ncbi:hypothetical protein [Ensifer sp.]|uniref:hypothetical protein n=1 Tax=Ensifer sp. TaxID=1872086 RepID=UPI00289A58CC|nr:hypothetical protein [Ensifer sp.]